MFDNLVGHQTIPVSRDDTTRSEAVECRHRKLEFDAGLDEGIVIELELLTQAVKSQPPGRLDEEVPTNRLIELIGVEGGELGNSLIAVIRLEILDPVEEQLVPVEHGRCPSVDVGWIELRNRWNVPSHLNER